MRVEHPKWRASESAGGRETRFEGKGPAEAPKPPAPVSVHQSGVARMRALRKIADAEWQAAKRFRDLWAAAHSDGLKAMDYSRVRVDGGGRNNMPGSLSRALRAHGELEAVREDLGDRDFDVLRIAAGIEGTMTDVAAAFGLKSRSQPGIWVKRALNNLADLWATKGADYGIRADAGTDRANSKYC